MKHTTRSLNLPKPVAAYFVCDEVSGDGFGQVERFVCDSRSHVGNLVALNEGK